MFFFVQQGNKLKLVFFFLYISTTTLIYKYSRSFSSKVMKVTAGLLNNFPKAPQTVNAAEKGHWGTYEEVSEGALRRTHYVLDFVLMFPILFIQLLNNKFHGLSPSCGHHSLLFGQGFQKMTAWDWSEPHLMVIGMPPDDIFHWSNCLCTKFGPLNCISYHLTSPSMFYSKIFVNCTRTDWSLIWWYFASL